MPDEELRFRLWGLELASRGLETLFHASFNSSLVWRRNQEPRIKIGAFQGVEHRWNVNKSLRVRGSNGTVSCMKIPGMLPRETASRLLSLVKGSAAYELEPDSVDQMPSFEFYPMVAGKWVDEALKDELDAFAQTVLLPYVRQVYRCSHCTLADILVRRYVAGERRTHQLHFDSHAFVTVVLGLSDPSEFEGGLYIQSGPNASSREFVPLEPGDVFVHSFDLQHGVRLWKGTRYSLVFWIKTSLQAVVDGTAPWYEVAAGRRDPDALFNLAGQYLEGTSGRDANPKKAAELYEQAAAMGHLGAQTHLGLLLAEADGPDLTASARWLQSAAKAGDVLGQKSLAFAYANGQGVQQNLTRSAKWMARAAEQDDLEAAYVLGTMYLHGQGVKVSRPQAERWLRQSAEAGYAEAQREMALFEKDKASNSPEEVNFTAVAAWLQLAARQGDREARLLLADLYSRQNRHTDALQLWRKLAKLGDAQAQWQLGKCYAEGRGTKAKPKKALALFSKAAAQGHEEAAQDLSRISGSMKTKKGSMRVAHGEISPRRPQSDVSHWLPMPSPSCSSLHKAEQGFIAIATLSLKLRMSPMQPFACCLFAHTERDRDCQPRHPPGPVTAYEAIGGTKS